MNFCAFVAPKAYGATPQLATIRIRVRLIVLYKSVNPSKIWLRTPLESILKIVSHNKVHVNNAQRERTREKGRYEFKNIIISKISRNKSEIAIETINSAEVCNFTRGMVCKLYAMICVISFTIEKLQLHLNKREKNQDFCYLKIAQRHGKEDFPHEQKLVESGNRFIF